MRAVLSFLFLMFAGIGLFAQVSQTGYYITKDGKRYNGVTIENPDYADACERVMISTEMDGGKYYYPKDIAAYGTDYGYKYVSALVSIDGDTANVFLKELIRDQEIQLYKYEGKKGEAFYMIDSSGKYAQIKDGGEHYRQLLQARAADCPVLTELNELPMKLTESSLTSLYESYTDCSVNNYPGITWGFAVNAGHTWFNFEDENRFEIPNRLYAMPGFFVEIPIDRRISFRAELYYFFTQTKSNEWTEELNMNSFEYKRHSLVLPLLFKYRFSNVQRKVLPYLEWESLKNAADWLRRYAAQPELAAEYPYVVFTGRSGPMYVHEQRRTIPWLREMQPRLTERFANGEDAAKLAEETWELFRSIK